MVPHGTMPGEGKLARVRKIDVREREQCTPARCRRTCGALLDVPFDKPLDAGVVHLIAVGEGRHKRHVGAEELKLCHLHIRVTSHGLECGLALRILLDCRAMARPAMKLGRHVHRELRPLDPCAARATRTRHQNRSRMGSPCHPGDSEAGAHAPALARTTDSLLPPTSYSVSTNSRRGRLNPVT